MAQLHQEDLYILIQPPHHMVVITSRIISFAIKVVVMPCIYMPVLRQALIYQNAITMISIPQELICADGIQQILRTCQPGGQPHHGMIIH